MIGNAVSVNVASWLGERLALPFRHKYTPAAQDQSFPPLPEDSSTNRPSSMVAWREQAFMVSQQHLPIIFMLTFLICTSAMSMSSLADSMTKCLGQAEWDWDRVGNSRLYAFNALASAGTHGKPILITTLAAI